MKFLAVSILIIFVCVSSRAFSNDTIRLNYAIGAHKLSLKNKQLLLSFGNQLTTSDSVYITGYADYLGDNESNMQLSVKRAATVKTFLSSLPQKTVIMADGRGELPATQSVEGSLGNYKDRRVDIVVRKTKASELGIVNSPLKPKGPAVNKSPLEKLKALKHVTPGQSFTLDDLNFKPGRHFPTQMSMDYLEYLHAYLKAYSNIEFEIQGYICCDTGGGDGLDSDTQEWALSVNRAKYVYDYLLRKGIPANRMSFKGFGSSKKKVTPEITEEDRQLNRRVELLILKQQN